MGAPRRPWGWHPLSTAWAERLVATSGVGPGDTVLDVGAGVGALTLPLIDTGARVIAIELHPGRRAELQRRVGDRARVVAADARDLRLPRRPFHVVASPPYSATSALLRRLLHPGSRMVSAHLVLQEQSARRWHAEVASGRHGPTTAELGPRLPRHAFTPPPRVPSRVLTLRRGTAGRPR